jgi:hypothetical protein
MLGFFAWLVLLAATAILAELAFHFYLAHVPAAFQGLAPSQQVAAILIGLMVLSLAAFALWQSYRIARQERDYRTLRGGIAGAQKTLAVVATSQKDFDAAVQHLTTSDPEEALSALQKQLAETEASAALQRGRNHAVDMQERLDEIRRRQQALREQIGEVAEKRRAVEPVFEELKDRQRQVDRSRYTRQRQEGCRTADRAPRKLLCRARCGAPGSSRIQETPGGSRRQEPDRPRLGELDEFSAQARSVCAPCRKY